MGRGVEALVTVTDHPEFRALTFRGERDPPPSLLPSPFDASRAPAAASSLAHARASPHEPSQLPNVKLLCNCLRTSSPVLQVLSLPMIATWLPTSSALTTSDCTKDEFRPQFLAFAASSLHARRAKFRLLERARSCFPSRAGAISIHRER